MAWLTWKHVRIPLISILSITFMLKLFSRSQNSRDLAVETYERHYSGRQLHKYKIGNDYFKAQADEAFKKFSFADDGPAPKQFEEIEMDPSYRRRKPPTVVPRIRPIEIQTSLYFMSDDGRYDATQIIRCAHDKHFHVNASSTCAEPETYREKPFNLTIWTMDYSSGTIADIKFLLEPLGVKFIDKSLSPNCNIFGTCSKNNPGIDALTGLFLNEDTANRFHSEHVMDRDFMSADIVLCVRPAAMCELYMPFTKSIIINLDTRYEFGRWEKERWEKWNANLEKITKDPNNLVSSTNQYDIEYTRYYTGYGPTLLKPYCGYIKHTYNPQISDNFLLSPIRQYITTFEQSFMQEFNQYSGIENTSAILTSMSQYRFDQASEVLVRYPGIILIPYQVSSQRMTELYRMNIPLFVPSLELLTNWQVQYGIITHMNWQRIARHVSANALMSMPGKISLPNPNDDRNKDSVGFWLNFTDFYSWPHLIRFSSVRDLVTKLRDYSASGKLQGLSRRMAKYNAEVKVNVKNRWMQILSNFQRRKNERYRNQH